MKLATWNVNSLNVRLPHVLEWIAAEKPDVLCLQETKQEDSKFPYDALKEAGYNAIHSGQKTYNGVAILSPYAIDNPAFGIPGYADEQKRVVSADINGIRIVCAYIPNGQSLESEKYQYKLNWLQALTNHLEIEMQQHPRLALLGDYNIAPEDRDVHDPKAWEGQALGLHDSFRLFEQEEGSFSWWDYRMAGFRRNLGLRIDHILVSDALKASCQRCWIDKGPRRLERPSDHTPVILELS
jgi:exodeoxyribonuclease-3